MSYFCNLIGKRFGRLIVIKDSGERTKSHEIYWLCKCDCGNSHKVCGGELRRGNVQSCGCLAKEVARFTLKKRLTTHGESQARLYHIWEAMKYRCNGSGCPTYKYYGKRGISVCDEWNHNYLIFKAWAISHGYRENLTIDRIDRNKGYESSNCQWISLSENIRKTFAGSKRRGQRGPLIEGIT